jgi:CBS domain-containing protein
MPNAFNFTASPFDCLTPDEQRRVHDHVDIAYFREGETLLDPAQDPTHLFVLIKGHVRELDGAEVVATYGPDDTFDGRALVAGRASHRFVAAEEVIAYELARDVVQALISGNATFGALLFADLSHKLGALAERPGRREMQALALARVGQAFLRPAHVVDAHTDIVAVARLFQQHRTSCVLVQGHGARAQANGSLGIFTTTGLQRAILDGRPLHELPVGELATPRVVSVAPDAPLFDALALMIRHQVHRLVVMDGGTVLGMLEQLDALSFVSNHAYLITVQIAQAADLQALGVVAARITQLIGLLHRGGTRVGHIARLVQELNAKLFERTWQLVAAPELVANSCLFVMGSEGRGEQLLRTDQDNGLVVRDGFDMAGVDAACERLSAALQGFGWPPCPGGIMVSNPAWRRHATPFADTVRRWLLQPEPEGLMALAVFVDAHPVAGDATLLADLRGTIDTLVAADDALLGRFAAAIDAFAESGASAWWNRLLAIGQADDAAIDLKKAGLFPIVHGVRSLALQQHVAATGTAQRLEALVAAGKLPAAFATDIVDSLHVLMGLKLQCGLAELDVGRPVSGAVHPGRLSSLERNLLKDALIVVKRFKALVRHQFHLDT